jgi:8-oxo-dGTP diphosphatase
MTTRVNEEDAIDQLILETEDYLGRVLAPGSATLDLLRRLAAGTRILVNKLSESEALIREARIACPLCRGKGYWSTDVYKNRPCHCKAGEMFASLTKPAVRVGVAVILRRGDRVLMGLRKGSHGAGTWSFPGGHLEPGETVFECASRELREETGIDVEPRRFRKSTYTNDVFQAEGKHYVTVYVEGWRPPWPGDPALDPTPEPKILEPEKCAEWRWQGSPPSPLFLPIENLLKDGFRVWPP